MREGRDLVDCAETGPVRMAGERWQRVAGRILFGAAVSVIAVGFAGGKTRAAASGADRAVGAELFKEKGCEHCHGADGVGSNRGPALTTVGKRLKKSEIEQQIRDGGKQMPPFGDVLTDDETNKLVEYLAHKKKAPRSAPGS